ncbi:UDP-N-acetyl-D-mannosaminuronic acid dehydrogenase [Halopelagius inordinatus]|uniref:UDP-N-acetyl-D-mannosamine dehydrogenase n=1 Tax=Halopelagius inordinatus TaxID=553467 RepID=A0A1I2U1P3_9EURY|nr:nucleotide sugar dehydrogenase [Halopelagius inordinatus]SFG70349.1 UDP-N-acetyl-D-mannosaminuronic acid dehydrogenase [Halopelagius inordinatus]
MKLCVHGIGYIGLATGALFANNGHDVVGYDPDEELVAELREGEPRTTEDDLREYVLEAMEKGFEPSTEPVEADCHLICVPTPYDEDAGRADMAYVETAGRAVADLLKPGDTVILESTVPPGTTADVLTPVLAESGLTPGEDFSVAHCPETVLPGNITHELVHNDRIIGGIDAESADRAIALYEPVTEGTIHRAPNATTAEFVKLSQNAYRDVNIAFANELARVAADYGIGSRDAIDLANNHPRVDILNPGPGVGGHCLPIDPWFLGQSSDSLDLVESARRVNDGMSEYVVELLESELGTLDGARIAVLGVAYKGNVDDTRRSPGLRLAETLSSLRPGDQRASAVTDGGTEVDVRLHDPHVEDDGIPLRSLDDSLRDADAIVISADHDAFADIDPERAASLVSNRVVVDATATLDADGWRRAGFEYVSL